MDNQKGRYQIQYINPILTSTSYVEYETEVALNGAVEKLNGTDFKGSIVHCIADVSLNCSLIYKAHIV